MGTSSMDSPPIELIEGEELPTNGRQGLDVAGECEGLKFEDLFREDFSVWLEHFWILWTHIYPWFQYLGR